jgi:hypothetical protein
MANRKLEGMQKDGGNSECKFAKRLSAVQMLYATMLPTSSQISQSDLNRFIRIVETVSETPSYQLSLCCLRFGDMRQEAMVLLRFMHQCWNYGLWLPECIKFTRIARRNMTSELEAHALSLLASTIPSQQMGGMRPQDIARVHGVM